MKELLNISPYLGSVTLGLEGSEEGQGHLVLEVGGQLLVVVGEADVTAGEHANVEEGSLDLLPSTTA